MPKTGGPEQGFVCVRGGEMSPEQEQALLRDVRAYLGGLCRSESDVIVKFGPNRGKPYTCGRKTGHLGMCRWPDSGQPIAEWRNHGTG